MKFLCVTCDSWNMTYPDAQRHKTSYPSHVIKDTLGRVRLADAEAEEVVE